MPIKTNNNDTLPTTPFAVISADKSEDKSPAAATNSNKISNELQALRSRALAQKVRKDLVQASADAPLPESSTAESFYMQQKNLSKEWKKQQEASKNLLNSYRGKLDASSTSQQQKKTVAASLAGNSSKSSEMDPFFLKQRQLGQEQREKQRAASDYLHRYKDTANNNGKSPQQHDATAALGGSAKDGSPLQHGRDGSPLANRIQYFSLIQPQKLEKKQALAKEKAEEVRLLGQKYQQEREQEQVKRKEAEEAERQRMEEEETIEKSFRNEEAAKDKSRTAPLDQEEAIKESRLNEEAANDQSRTAPITSPSPSKEIEAVTSEVPPAVTEIETKLDPIENRNDEIKTHDDAGSIDSMDDLLDDILGDELDDLLEEEPPTVKDEKISSEVAKERSTNDDAPATLQSKKSSVDDEPSISSIVAADTVDTMSSGGDVPINKLEDVEDGTIDSADGTMDLTDEVPSNDLVEVEDGPATSSLVDKMNGLNKQMRGINMKDEAHEVGEGSKASIDSDGLSTEELQGQFEAAVDDLQDTWAELSGKLRFLLKDEDEPLSASKSPSNLRTPPRVSKLATTSKASGLGSSSRSTKKFTKKRTIGKTSTARLSTPNTGRTSFGSATNPRRGATNSFSTPTSSNRRANAFSPSRSVASTASGYYRRQRQSLDNDGCSVVSSASRFIRNGDSMASPSSSRCSTSSTAMSSTTSSRANRREPYASPLAHYTKNQSSPKDGPDSAQKKSSVPKVCTSKWIANLHDARSGCDRCLHLASPSMVEYYDQHNHHPRINLVRGGCVASCQLFPRTGPDQSPVRLCRQCFYDTHALGKA